MQPDTKTISMSTGYIKDGTTHVTQGPLQGREKFIRRIDRHKRLAWLVLPAGDVVKSDPEAEKKIPYMNSDYSEYLVKVLGDDFSTDMWEWITGLTGIHKLTYKLSDSINRNNSFYRYILENKE